jgi:hypothetical protein
MTQSSTRDASGDGASRPGNVRISVTLRQRYLDLLDRLAERNDLPRTTAATVILETALERMKAGGPSLPTAHLVMDPPVALPSLPAEEQTRTDEQESGEGL